MSENPHNSPQMGDDRPAGRFRGRAGRKDSARRVVSAATHQARQRAHNLGNEVREVVDAQPETTGRGGVLALVYVLAAMAVGSIALGALPSPAEIATRPFVSQDSSAQLGSFSIDKASLTPTSDERVAVLLVQATMTSAREPFGPQLLLHSGDSTFAPEQYGCPLAQPGIPTPCESRFLVPADVELPATLEIYRGTRQGSSVIEVTLESVEKTTPVTQSPTPQPPVPALQPPAPPLELGDDLEPTQDDLLAPPDPAPPIDGEQPNEQHQVSVEGDDRG
ncbi:hypothetical protein [Corynebacterium aquilae]|uniref:Uncharacterized protein n=1 Tax=Corynebacterium aquilae DSM 44791 TaxID=1431546 RepID=A0A1L7CFB1_9CORY|nr:hypothetical protein [Corynebacterium aquilae]APT84542.1 hypothetical protein CAQU_05135 [Corynebacterium aquilae DSM 44791]